MARIPEKHAQKIKFGLVGIANTGLDFILLFLFVNLGLNTIVSNYLSTGVSFVFSFFVNRSFTFKHKTGDARKQFILFLAVTIFGLWVLQPAVIWLITAAFGGLIGNEGLTLFVAKLLATVVSLVWNYLFYSRLVFRKSA